ncbi:MAG: hypothetical protein R3A78_06675 [Polyangiales bacterium]
MRNAQDAYEQARYENALVWLDAVADDLADMDRPTRARYFYLRGMAEHRLGRDREARHDLALARELGGGTTKILPDDWRRNMERVLADLELPGKETENGRRE